MHTFRHFGRTALCIVAICACPFIAHARQVPTRSVKLNRVDEGEASTWLAKVSASVPSSHSKWDRLQVLYAGSTNEVFLAGAPAEIQLAEAMLRMIDGRLPSPR
jgi:hypothetical protein